MRRADEVRHTIELVCGGGIAAGLTFAYILAAGRMLAPSAYGEFSAALSFFYVVAVASSPLTPTIARLVTRYELTGQHERSRELQRAAILTVIRWSVIAAIPLLIGTILLSTFLRFVSPLPILLALGSALVFALLSVQRGMLQGQGRFRSYVGNTILEAGLRLAAAMALLYYFASPTAALAAYLAALLVAGVPLGGVPAASASKSRIDWTDFTKLAGPTLIAMVGLAVLQNVDILAVKRWFSSGEAGYYGAATSILRVISVLFVSVYTISGPLLTHRFEKGESLIPATLRLCAYFIALAAVPTLLFAAWGQNIVVMFYGPAFREAGHILVALSGLPMLTYLSVILGQAFITLGDRAFGRVYLAFACLQILAFWFAHDTIWSLIRALYLVQGSLLVVMLLLMHRLRREGVRC